MGDFERVIQTRRRGLIKHTVNNVRFPLARQHRRSSVRTCVSSPATMPGALQYVQDPAMRKTPIDQYRAAGIDVGEDA
jgi:hypothetical protein